MNTAASAFAFAAFMAMRFGGGFGNITIDEKYPLNVTKYIAPLLQSIDILPHWFSFV
jgi:hypothetical protein